MALVEEWWLVKISRIIPLGFIALIIAGAVFVMPLFQKHATKLNVAGVSNIVGAYNGSLYYTVGTSLIERNIKTGAMNVISSNLNSASMSPDGSKLFYRTLIDYKLKGTLQNLDTGAKTSITNFTDTLWYKGQLGILRQTGGSYTLFNEVGAVLFSNLTDTNLYAMGDTVLFSATNDLATLETPTLNLKSIDSKGVSSSVLLRLMSSNPISNGTYVTFIDQGNSLVAVSQKGTKNLDINLSNGVYTASAGTAQLSVGFIANGSKTDLVISELDFLNGGSNLVHTYSIGAPLPVSTADTGSVTTNAARVDNNLYILVGSDIWSLPL